MLRLIGRGIRPTMGWWTVALLLAVATSPLWIAPAAAAENRSSPDPEGEWPLQPVPAVSAYFEPPPHPYAAGHRGVDLVGRPGQAVRSALPGEVRFAGQVAGRPVVVVGHGGTRTTYQPVVSSVAVGDEVAAGQIVGTLIGPGSHCAPRTCLHWGWIRGEEYLDPLRLVGFAPVRLLPLWSSTPTGWTTPRSTWCQARGWAC